MICLESEEYHSRTSKTCLKTGGRLCMGCINVPEIRGRFSRCRNSLPQFQGILLPGVHKRAPVSGQIFPMSEFLAPELRQISPRSGFHPPNQRQIFPTSECLVPVLRLIFPLPERDSTKLTLTTRTQKRPVPDPTHTIPSSK